jgi:hypothetical protein
MKTILLAFVSMGGSMAKYTIRQGGNQRETILEIEGPVTAADWESLRYFCLNALTKEGDFVLDLEKVSEYDFSLSIFVCLLRKTVLLLGKQLTIMGRPEEFVCLYSCGAGCANSEACDHCLCESLFTERTAIAVPAPR